MKRRLLAGVTAVVAAVGAFVELGRYFQFTEQPRPADVIMILCGDPSRAIKAAELYKQGLAPEVWIGQDYREAYFRRLDRIGIKLPPEEEIIKKALIERGVPAAHIHFCGKNNLSTLEEATALRAALGRDGERILIVTALWHTRRAKMIFGWVFPKATLTAVSDGDMEYHADWWRHKFTAEYVAKEALDTAYLLIGGARLNHEP